MQPNFANPVWLLTDYDYVRFCFHQIVDLRNGMQNALLIYPNAVQSSSEEELDTMHER
jgi:hypothetical protein